MDHKDKKEHGAVTDTSSPTNTQTNDPVPISGQNTPGGDLPSSLPDVPTTGLQDGQDKANAPKSPPRGPAPVDDPAQGKIEEADHNMAPALTGKPEETQPKQEEIQQEQVPKHNHMNMNVMDIQTQLSSMFQFMQKFQQQALQQQQNMQKKFETQLFSLQEQNSSLMQKQEDFSTRINKIETGQKTPKRETSALINFDHSRNTPVKANKTHDNTVQQILHDLNNMENTESIPQHTIPNAVGGDSGNTTDLPKLDSVHNNVTNVKHKPDDWNSVSSIERQPHQSTTNNHKPRHKIKADTLPISGVHDANAFPTSGIRHKTNTVPTQGRNSDAFPAQGPQGKPNSNVFPNKGTHGPRSTSTRERRAKNNAYPESRLQKTTSFPTQGMHNTNIPALPNQGAQVQTAFPSSGLPTQVNGYSKQNEYKQQTGGDPSSSEPESSYVSDTPSSSSYSSSSSNKRRTRNHKRKKRSRFRDSHRERHHSPLRGVGGSYKTEKDIDAVRRGMGVNGNENAVLWLRKYRRYTEKFKWTKTQVINRLPQIYKPNDFKQVQKADNWYEGLSEKTRNNFKLLQRSFLEKFGKKALRNFLDDTENGLQPLSDPCLDWFRRVWKDRSYLEEWAPHKIRQERVFLEEMGHRFTNAVMKMLIANASADPLGEGEPRSLTYSQYISMCSIADLNSDFTQHSESNGMKAIPGDKDSPYPILNIRSDTHTDRVHGIIDEAVLQLRYTDSDDSDEYDMYRCMAVQRLNSQGYPSSNSAIRKATNSLAKSRAPIPYIREASEQEITKAGWENIFGVNASKEKPCPWHNCQEAGCSKGERCSYSHTMKRNSTPCEDAQKGHCRKGIFCNNRHLDDIYDIWFRNRKSGTFKLYSWKDTVSPFSRFSSRR